MARPTKVILKVGTAVLSSLLYVGTNFLSENATREATAERIAKLGDEIITTEDPEVHAWKNCHPDDLWIFDKLLLSNKFNYLCGPGCVPVPKADFYVVRPRYISICLRAAWNSTIFTAVFQNLSDG